MKMLGHSLNWFLFVCNRPNVPYQKIMFQVSNHGLSVTSMKGEGMSLALRDQQVVGNGLVHGPTNSTFHRTMELKKNP